MPKKTENLLPQTEDLEKITQANQQSMQAVMKSYNTWLQSAARVQTEMLSFMNKRIRAEMELPNRFAGCKNPAEVVERQISFASTMFQDYVDEGQKMLGLMNEAASDFRQEVEETFTDKPSH